ncbi:MAG TPA: tetratricopeptide repeat protein [Candidatus Eisenbacteria bacterium]|nr:tetratricopeptide repeat protein [Candidatus Eisenbacteria bacterium]
MSRKRKKTTALSSSQPLASPAPTSPTSNSPRRFHLAILILVSLLLYAPTLRNGFVTDDRIQILENSLVLEAKNLGLAFTGDVWAFARSPKDAALHGTNYYRPLQPLLYTAEYQMWGPNPLYWHLVDTLLNAAVVVLVYLVIVSLDAPLLAFWAALCFALHPMHSEPVSWIAALPELLCALFLLLAMLYYRRADASPSPLRLLLLSAFFFLCALLSKEPAILFPVILLCYEVLYHRFRLANIRRMAARLSPFLIVLALYLAARIAALGGFSPRQIMDRPRLSFVQLFFAIPAVFARYIGKLFLPIHMNYFYAFPLTTTLTSWALAGFIASVLLAAAVVFFYRTSRPLLGFAICWFVFTLAPALSLNSIALNFFTERYLYIPSFGFAILAASAGIALYSNLSVPVFRLAFGACVTAIFLFFIVQTERRVALFYDNYTLVGDAVRKSPNSYIAQGQYASALYDRHDLDGALEHVRLAIQLNPDYILGHLNTAWYLKDKGEYDPAILQLKEAIRLYPTYVISWENLAHVYALKRDWKAAADTYRHAATLDSSFSAYFSQLASIADVNAQSQSEVSSLQSTLAANPRDFSAWAHLGDTASQSNQWPQAADAYEHAAALQPQNATVLGKWGMSLLRMNEWARAADILQRAVNAQPDSLLIRQLLAGALAGSNRLTESTAELHKILQMNPRWEHADQVHLTLGSNAERSGDFVTATQEYQRALALNPSLTMATQRLAALHALPSR